MREMLLSELVKNYRPVYPEPYSWEATAEHLYTHDAEHMATLTESLLSKGWREPIILEDLDEETDEDDFPHVGDGTHRVVIALTHGVFTVPTIFRSEQPTEYDILPLEIVIENLGDPLSEAAEDELVNRFHSFPLNEDIWLTSDVMFGAGNRRVILLNFDDEAYATKISAKTRGLLKSLFPDSIFTVTVRRSVESDEV